MINKLRAFSKTKLATVLVAIIIVPFVFWGMGSVFSGGNTNSLAKINNHSISTEDFIDHINNLNINEEIIREKINENILEEILTALISKELLALEIKDLNIFISDKTLVEKIKNFYLLDENFSIENGLLTPTMKIKRSKVIQKYKNILENFYKK